MKLSQKQKILTIMCRDKYSWFYPYDLIGKDDLFVGYKAPTRISELHHDYPQMFISKTEGKYVVRRLNGEAFMDWFPSLSKDLKQVVAKELNYFPQIGVA